MDQGLGPNKDLEALDQIRLKPLPWSIRHLQPDQVWQARPQLLDHGGLHCVTAARGELVQKKGQRRAGATSGREVFDERSVVQREVGRRDHRHRVRADLGRMRGKRHCGCGCLRAAVNYHDLPPTTASHKRFGRGPALGCAQEDALASCAECEDPVDAGGDKVLNHRSDRLEIDRVPAVPQGRHGRSNGTAEHGREFLRHFSTSVRDRKH
jgi:hypothetical protein